MLSLSLIVGKIFQVVYLSVPRLAPSDIQGCLSGTCFPYQFVKKQNS